MSFQLGAFQTDAFQQGSGAGQNLSPPFYTNDNAFYGPAVTRGAVNLSPARYNNANTFFGPQLNLSLSAARFDNNNAFYSARVDLKLQQSARFNNTNAFYAPSIAFRVDPPLLTNTSLFYSPVVSQPGGVQHLVCEDYVNTGYVVPDYVTFPASFTDNRFFAAALSYDQTLLAARYNNENTFFVPGVYNQYPNPWQVLAGVVYGPNGQFTGTLSAGRPIYVFDD